MNRWFSQIVIGIIVTVAGTMIANSLMPKYGKYGGGWQSSGYSSGPWRSGRR